MNSAIPRVEFDPDRADPRLAAVAAAIEEAGCPDREGPYGLYDYTTYDHPLPHHVRDFRYPGTDTYGDCVYRSDDREKAHAVYTRLNAEHVARAAIAATLKALGLERALRTQAVAATAEQRAAGRSGPLYAYGDMELVWVNSGDLQLHSGLLMLPDQSPR